MRTTSSSGGASSASPMWPTAPRASCAPPHTAAADGMAAAIALQRPPQTRRPYQAGAYGSAAVRTAPHRTLPAGRTVRRGMLPPKARISASSEFALERLRPDGTRFRLDCSARRAYPGRRPRFRPSVSPCKRTRRPADGRTAQFVAQGQLHPGHDRQAARFRPPGGRKQTDRRFRNVLRSTAVRLHLLHGQSRRKHSDEFGDRLRPDFGIQHRQSRGLQFRQADSAGGHRGRCVRILVSKAPSRREKHRARILRAADLLRGRKPPQRLLPALHTAQRLDPGPRRPNGRRSASTWAKNGPSGKSGCSSTPISTTHWRTCKWSISIR